MTPNKFLTTREHLAALKELVVIPDGIHWEYMENKWWDGALSHAGEPNLSEMSDGQLEQEIQHEKIDLAFYEAEKKRREKI